MAVGHGGGAPWLFLHQVFQPLCRVLQVSITYKKFAELPASGSDDKI